MCVVCGAVNWRTTCQYSSRIAATDPTPKNLSLGEKKKKSPKKNKLNT